MLNRICGKDNSLACSIQKDTRKDNKEMMERPGAVNERRDVRASYINSLACADEKRENDD